MLSRFWRWLTGLFRKANEVPADTRTTAERVNDAADSFADALAETSGEDSESVREQVRQEIQLPERPEYLSTHGLPEIMPVALRPYMKEVDFAPDQYFHESVEKRGFILHHTASGTATSALNWWRNDPARVATPYIIDRDGTILRLFDPLNGWAYATNIRSSGNRIPSEYKVEPHARNLEKAYIQIELVSWGWLDYDGRSYRNWLKGRVPGKHVHTYAAPYRWKRHYHAYTERQLDSLKQLMLWHHYMHGVPVKYRGEEIFDIHEEALQAKPGTWVHTSFRTDKSDCHPQPELLQVLNELNEA